MDAFFVSLYYTFMSYLSYTKKKDLEKITLNHNVENEITQEILDLFCSIKNDNNLHIDYRVFKIVANPNTYETIHNYVVKKLQTVLEKYELFNIHVNFKTLSLTELDKHYSFINKVCVIFKNEFPDKLDKCSIYNAPFIFSQVFNIISIFIDKKTQSKIQLVRL